MKGVMAMDEKARKMLAEELLQLVEQRKIEVQEFRESVKKNLIDYGTGTEEEIEARLADINFDKLYYDVDNAEAEIKKMFNALYPHAKESEKE